MTWKASAVRSIDAPIGTTASTSQTWPICSTHGSLLGDDVVLGHRSGQVRDDQQRTVRPLTELLRLHFVGQVAG